MLKGRTRGNGTVRKDEETRTLEKRGKGRKEKNQKEGERREGK